MERKPKYFVRFEEEFDSFNRANIHKSFLDHKIGMGIPTRVGYFMSQPQYKSWVPNWLIRLIIKP